MASAGRAHKNKQPTPLNAGRKSTGGTGYVQNKGKQVTTAQNPALSKQNAKNVIKQGTPFHLGPTDKDAP